MRLLFTLPFLLPLIAFADPALDDSSSTQLTQRLENLERQVQQLQQSPSPSASTDWTAASSTNSFTGLGPVESKIYFAPESRWQAGLNAQLFSYTQQTGTDRSNVGSVEPSFGLRLHPRLLFNSQFLLENGGSESSDTVTLRKGQAVVNMAYLDWALTENREAGLRIGHQFVPVGITNTSHGPTTYFSVRAPELERTLIPGSWHENGVLAYIERPRATVEAGAFSSLDAAGFRQSTFLGGGREQGQNAAAEDLLGVFRLNLHGEHALIGGSFAFGNTAQGNTAIRTGAFQLMEGHVRLMARRFQLTGQMAQGHLADADAISLLNSSVVAESAKGASLEGAFDLVAHDTRHLWLFSRYSHVNLQDRVPSGMSADASLNETVWSNGVNYYPQENVVIKVDYAQSHSAAGSGDKAFELGAAFFY